MEELLPNFMHIAICGLSSKDAKFILRGTELEWLDEVQVKPTQLEIDNEIARLEAYEPTRKQIEDYKKYLSDTDFKMAKDYPKDTTEVVKLRKEARDYIYANEGGV